MTRMSLCMIVRNPCFAWYFKGAAEARVGRYTDAEDSLAMALRLHPGNAEARRLLGLVRTLVAAGPMGLAAGRGPVGAPQG